MFYFLRCIHVTRVSRCWFLVDPATCSFRMAFSSCSIVHTQSNVETLMLKTCTTYVRSRTTYHMPHGRIFLACICFQFLENDNPNEIKRKTENNKHTHPRLQCNGCVDECTQHKCFHSPGICDSNSSLHYF